MPTTIAVRGNAEERIDPELGAVSLSVSASGAERENTLARTTEAHERLVAEVRGLEASGVLDTWSAGQLRVWSHRPWNAEGKQLPVVHEARADLEVIFNDLERLGEWVSEVSLRSSLTVGGIEWKLTDATQRSVQADAQRAAVADAVEKASVYASALGLGSPTPVELADTGLLTAQPLPPPGVGVERVFAMRGAADASGGASPAQFTPAQLVIAASVDARFAAETAGRVR
ncbi:SIMPL domain-containing protein [Agromyces sp. ISL-38]|uniref:SIMPL domain-containing protein n=1 Tax=Agromyces sp. ISL-38 TaxID=2819107 RepID=UPI001BEB8328|nr:SIMPL domain-containing protein [Agromyces sp. ISL-38]MBT2499597.1 SIMPL domain-containing protein [Agromyces sp. ISL-38]